MPHFDYKEVHSNVLRSRGHNFRLYDCKGRCLYNSHCMEIDTQVQNVPMSKLHVKQDECLGAPFRVLFMFYRLPYITKPRCIMLHIH